MTKLTTEPEVIKKVADYFRNIEYQVWIDDHPTLKGLAKEIYPRHSIYIAGRRPDIILVDKLNRIHAIEAKGTKDFLKGIMQASIYRQGCHFSYLAGDHSKLDENIIIMAKKQGLSIIQTNSEINIIKEESGSNPIYLNDVQNELNILRTTNTKKRLTYLGRNHPLNYALIPILVNNNIKTKDELKEKIEEFGISRASSHCIKGAQVLNMVTLDGTEYKITEKGSLLCRMAKLIGKDTFEAFKELKEKTPRRISTIFDEERDLATVLRVIYDSNNDFQIFLQVLKNLAPKTTLSEICIEMARTVPNAFINLCINNKSRLQVEKLLVNNKLLDSITSDFLRDHLYYNFYFTFKAHLIQLGYIEQVTLHGTTSDKLNPDEDTWEIRKL